MKDEQTIFQKMILLKKSIDVLYKDERNEFHKFNYVSSYNVLKSVREKMNELGILVVPKINKSTVTQINYHDEKAQRLNSSQSLI